MSIARNESPRHDLEIQNKDALSINEESPSDASIQEQRTEDGDVEKGRPSAALRRETSGPPYSIFSHRMKMWIIFLVSISAVISPFAATTYYPALNVMSDVLHVSSTMTNISITTYMIAQAIAPAVIGGMSDTSGRRLSFIVCFVIFIVADIGLALQTNYAALLILRMVQAAGASASISLAIAVVADIATSAERGKFMGYATAGILFGPAFGPTIGGVLVQYLGWRSVFWFLAIYAGVLLVLFALLFPETCRKVVGNGSIPAKGINQSLVSYLQRRNLSKNSPNPQPQDIQPKKTKVNWSSLNPLLTLRILAEKESCIVLLYNGFFFTGMMVTSTSVPSLYKHFYALDELQIGLCYISLGAGSLTSALTAGHITDWNFRRHATRLNIPITKGKQQDLRTFPIEVARLQVATPGHFIGTAGLLIFGWTIHFGTHLAVPEIALFLIGFGVSTAFSGTNTLLIDLHRDRPATATAAVNFVRCLMSAGGCAAIVPMWRSWGPGWAYTFIAGLYVGLYGVVVWVMRRGMRWRGELEERKARKGERCGHTG